MSQEANEAKIIIDSDWKKEAAEEKKRLDEQAKNASQLGPLPPADFYEIINLLVMQATVGLGGFKGPTGEAIEPDLVMAKYFIDLLEVLENKTKGNLDGEEKRALEAVLYELRMGYVHAASPGAAGAAGPNPA